MDYFFYRLYRMYDKHGDPPLCSSICYLSFCLDVIFLIVYVYLVNTIDRYIWFLEDFYPILFVLLIQLILVLYWSFRYSDKKILELKKKYQGCLRNKLIADWMIFLVPICIIIILFALLYYSIDITDNNK